MRTPCRSNSIRVPGWIVSARSRVERAGDACEVLHALLMIASRVVGGRRSALSCKPYVYGVISIWYVCERFEEDEVYAMRTDVDVLVLGGGIGGLATALSLAKTGRTVHLTEQALQFSEIGAGLQLGPNAVRSLDRLGVWDALRELAVTPRSGIIMSATSGAELTRIDFGAPFVARYGYPYVVAHRHDVLDVLLHACEGHPRINLEVGKRAVSVTESVDGAVVVYEDDQEIVASLLVGADGLHSKTLAQHDLSEPKFTGHVAFRGTMPMDQVTLAFDPADMVLWIGPSLHMIQYPVRGGKLYNQVAVIESARFAQGREDWGSREELYEVFESTVPAVRESLAIFDDSRRWPIYDRDPIGNWLTEHSVLIGDAAHAMRQYLAQGACQALEDAIVLGQEIASCEEQRTALTNFQARRIERTTKCQLVARPWGDLWHTHDSLLQIVRNKLFESRAHDDYREIDWLYADHNDTFADATKR